MRRRRIVAVVVVAPVLGMAVPVIPPVIAQERASCTTWSAEMLEDEGGPVLTAQACSTDRPDAYLSLTCFAGRLNLRHDLGLAAEASVPLGEVTDVTFSSGSDAVTLAMAYQEMDGRHAADAGLDDPLIQLLKAGEAVTIADVAGLYPVKQFSLKGSSAALGRLVAACD